VIGQPRNGFATRCIAGSHSRTIHDPAFALSLVLLVAGRLLVPIPLPGLFLILIPAAMGLIFTGLIKQEK
jgi:hypothetical protein